MVSASQALADVPGDDTPITKWYDHSNDSRVVKLCLLGATNSDLAQFFGITITGFDRWIRDNKSLKNALSQGRELADSEVANSMYQRANGARWREQQAFKMGSGENERIELVYVERAAPPDTAAAFIWLKNRRRDLWRDKWDALPPGANVPADAQAAFKAAGLTVVEPTAKKAEHARNDLDGDDEKTAA